MVLFERLLHLLTCAVNRSGSFELNKDFIIVLQCTVTLTYS